MTATALREHLNLTYGSGPWPDHIEVDGQTYANVCQAIFDYHQEAVLLVKGCKKIPIIIGPNNGIMYKNVELILKETR